MMQTRSLKRIGVLGGMGPQATVLLQQRLIDATTAEDDVHHIPLLIDMNPQVPSRLDYLLHAKGNDPGPILQKMAQGLQEMGAEAIVMPCNTAHYFAPEIVAAIHVPFLHMVDLAAQRLFELLGAGQKVGILASPATEKIKLFHHAFAKFNMGVVFPCDRDAMLSSIRRIKKQGVREEDRTTLMQAAQSCEAQGASGLLIGCSEFSLIERNGFSQLPTVDSLDRLVEEMVDFAHREQPHV